jgi:hypothetical protein
MAHSIRVPFGRATRAVPLAVLLVGLVGLVACGENPYKESPKKCKLACGDDAGVQGADPTPRKTQPVPLSINFWDANTTRSSLEEKALLTLLQTNPFTEIARSLLQEAEAVKTARALARKAKSDAEKCHVEKFAAATRISSGRAMLAADYGRCVPLASLSATQNQKQGYTGADPRRVRVTEYEIGFQATLPAAQALVAAKRSLVTPARVQDWLAAFPFVGIRPEDVTRGPDGAFSTLAFDFQTAFLSAFEVYQSRKLAGAVRSFQARGGGYSPVSASAAGLRSDDSGDNAESTDAQVAGDSPGSLRVTFLDDGETLRIDGSVYVVGGRIVNPEGAQPYRGEEVSGSTAEFVFDAFTLKGSDLVVDATLGFRQNAVLGGAYYVFVNDNLDPRSKARQAGTSVWQFKAKDEKCLLDVGRVYGQDDIRPAGGHSLCQ